MGKLIKDKTKKRNKIKKKVTFQTPDFGNFNLVDEDLTGLEKDMVKLSLLPKKSNFRSLSNQKHYNSKTGILKRTSSTFKSLTILEVLKNGIPPLDSLDEEMKPSETTCNGENSAIESDNFNDYVLV